MSAGLEILNLHAQGGMAEVYRARATDPQGNTWHYAVKRILPELLKDPEMMRMFVEEQRIAACLVHENIVRVYDVARMSGGAGPRDAADTYIVMEFLEGKDLAEVIEAANAAGRQLPVWFTLHVAREVLTALQYASTEARDKSGRVLGLIHRDISPHNIFICRDGQVKLTDFGVARVENAEVRTRAGVIKGKFGYMSPEQLMGGKLDPRSDLYNVGILLYEAITGQRLFFGETATQFITAMMVGEVPGLDARLLVPPELDALMRRALSKDREVRPPTAAAFAGELATIASSYNLVARRGHVAQELASLFPELLQEAERATEPLPQGLAAADDDDAPVFTSSRPASTVKPVPRPAVAAPVPDVTDDGLMPTLLETRPDLGDLAPASSSAFRSSSGVSSNVQADDEIPRTEPSRVPFRPADPASTTAPAPPAHRRVVTGSARVRSLEQTDDDGVLPPRRR